MDFFAERILNWYKENGRDLPWRHTSDPYKIWVSEIMLQQTRVDQAHDYYIRFLERFPDVDALAAAAGDEVMKYWQGLGYYSRARNMHSAAIHMAAAGGFPDSYEGVRALKGVGDYTAAAICSFAYGMPYAVVDGNVYRILARWLGVRDPIDSHKGKKLFASFARELLCRECPAEYNQAIMDFGAIQCVPVAPACETCPLSSSCVAFKTHTVDVLPVKKGKGSTIPRFFNYLYIHSDTHVFLHKRERGDIWQGLYEFPLIETSSELTEEQLLLMPECRKILDSCVDPCRIAVFPKIRHVLTHRHIYATCYDFSISGERGIEDLYQKIPTENIDKFPVSRLISRFFTLILKQNT